MLDPAHMHFSTIEIDLIPAQVNELGDPQALAAGDQNQSGIAMAITIACRSLDELFNLGVSQIFAGPDLGIRRSLRSRRRLGPREFDDRQPAQFGATDRPSGATVPFLMAGAMVAECSFSIDFSPFLGLECQYRPKMALTGHRSQEAIALRQ